MFSILRSELHNLNCALVCVWGGGGGGCIHSVKLRTVYVGFVAEGSLSVLCALEFP